MYRLRDGSGDLDDFPEGENDAPEMFERNEVMACPPERISESQVAQVDSTPVARSLDGLHVEENVRCRCTANPSQPTETACRFLVVQIIIHIALLVVVTGICSLVGCILVIIGGSIPVCCMMNKRGWQCYLASQALALALFVTDIFLFIAYAGAIMLMPSIGAISAITGLLLGMGALKYFTATLPTSVEVQIPAAPKPFVATASSPETETEASGDSYNAHEYMVGVVSAYAAEEEGAEGDGRV